MKLASFNLLRWTALFCACTVVATFAHECAHGLGARLDGVHVSTGFNRVGMPGRSPADPDFRRGLAFSLTGAVAGPLASLLFAGGSLALMPRYPSTTAAWFGGLAVANAGLRFFPMAAFSVSAVMGKPHLEDEVGVGMYLAGLPPDSGRIPAPDVLRAPVFWLVPSLSLLVSLFLLARSLRRLAATCVRPVESLPLWGFYLCPVLAFLLMAPLLNLLDRHIRINW